MTMGCFTKYFSIFNTLKNYLEDLSSTYRIELKRIISCIDFIIINKTSFFKCGQQTFGWVSYK